VSFDGSAGLRAAEMTAFDIIVLDVMLPFLDGLEVAKRLRFQSIRTPILLFIEQLTGHAGTAKQRKSYKTYQIVGRVVG
jgi:DNA-binding response OmpR family regulator